MSFTHPLFILLHLGAFAFTLSLALTGFMIFAGLLDVPVARSSHKKIIPTAGGAGLVAGLGAGLLALAMFYPQLGNIRILGQLAALGFGVSFLGLLDDIYELSFKLKFFVIFTLSSAAILYYWPAARASIRHVRTDSALLAWVCGRGALAVCCHQCGQFYGRGQWPDGRGDDGQFCLPRRGFLYGWS